MTVANGLSRLRPAPAEDPPTYAMRGTFKRVLVEVRGEIGKTCTVKDLAERLGVCPQSIYNRLQAQGRARAEWAKVDAWPLTKSVEFRKVDVEHVARKSAASGFAPPPAMRWRPASQVPPLPSRIDAPPAPLVEFGARSRFSKDIMPVNPHVIGGAAPIVVAADVTPEHIDASDKTDRELAGRSNAGLSLRFEGKDGKTKAQRAEAIEVRRRRERSGGFVE